MAWTGGQIERGGDYHQFPFGVETIPEILLPAIPHEYLLNTGVKSI